MATAGGGGGAGGAGLGGAAGSGSGPCGPGPAAGTCEDARGPAPPALHPEEVAARLQRMRRELSNRRKILVKNLPQDSNCQVRGRTGRRRAPGAAGQGSRLVPCAWERSGEEGVGVELRDRSVEKPLPRVSEPEVTLRGWQIWKLRLREAMRLCPRSRESGASACKSGWLSPSPMAPWVCLGEGGGGQVVEGEWREAVELS